MNQYEQKQANRNMIRVHPYVPEAQARRMLELARQARDEGRTDADRWAWVTARPSRLVALQEAWEEHGTARAAIDALMDVAQ